ncbi:MAG: gephyrin-like molybdotransferase Glp [Lawsonibacter sp.]
MLSVKTPDEVFAVITDEFTPSPKKELVSLDAALGRVLWEEIRAKEFVPGFDRSTVDGFAVRASDTFGCSDAIPSILTLDGEIRMGSSADTPLRAECCVAVPTGGAVPPGSDAVVMLEYTQQYGDGTIGISKPVAPGANLIFKGDDVSPGKAVLPAGRRLTVQDIGALAAVGVAEVPVCRRPVVGILSTGDELVPVTQQPTQGQVRDVNSAMLRALMEQAGAEVKSYGIIRDEEDLLSRALETARKDCDVILLSGGSSVGTKDATCRVIEAQGNILFHGIAMKPGKPTIFGKVDGKPVIGLPGHPVAAFFVAHLFVCPLLARLTGRVIRRFPMPAVLAETVGANHGRAQYTGVFLAERDGTLYAHPIHGKSGLITTLASSDGYFCIPRDCEGVSAGQTVSVTLYTID